MNVGKRFKELRVQAGFSTAESFAVHAKVSRSFVSNFERNQSSPSVRTIQSLIKHLPSTLAQFFAEEDEPLKEYRSAKREVITMTEDQQVWVDKLLRLLQSGDRARILMLQGMLEWEPQEPDQRALKKVVGGSIPKVKGANNSAKKERAS